MAVLVYEGEITDEIIKNYEISRTEYIKVQLKDGTEYTLHFGMQKPGTSSCFAVVEEMNKVYLMNSTYKDSIIITKENLLHTKIFNFNDEGKIKGIESPESSLWFFLRFYLMKTERGPWNFP